MIRFNIKPLRLIVVFLLFFFGRVNAQIQVDQSLYYTIDSISVKGAESYDSKSIINYLGIKVGDDLQVPSKKISKAIKKIWELNLFKKVDIYIIGKDKEKNSVILEIDLEQVPKISQFIFKGISSSEKEDVEKKLNLKPGKRATGDIFTAIRRVILEDFKKEGYLKTSVDIHTKKDSVIEDAVKVYVNVDKKNKVKIREIQIIGNKGLSDSDIKSAMDETFEKSFWNIFSSSKLVEEDYQKDLKNIIDLYREKGYRDASIQKDSIYYNDDETIDIKININEGNKFYFRNINFVGNTLFKTDFLKDFINVKKGDIYNLKELNEKIQNTKGEDDIKSIYMDRGHMFASVYPVETTIYKDSIDMEIRIFEGKPVTINKVIVKGNRKVNDNVILREMRTKPGNMFSKSDIKRSYRDIAQLKLFDAENIGVNPIPNTQNNTVDIEYTVVEKGMSNIELQGGWGGNAFIGAIGFKINNISIENIFNADEWSPIPMGDAQTLAFNFRSSYYFDTYSISFSDPWWGDVSPLAVSFSLYHTKQLKYISRNIDYQKYLSITGGSLGIRKRLQWPDDFFYISHQLSYERYSLRDYKTYLFDFDNGKSNNISYQIMLGRNSSGPNPIFPMQGSDIQLSFKSTIPYSLFKEVTAEMPTEQKLLWMEYFKFKLKGTWYAPIYEKLTLKTHFEFGYLGIYDKDIGLSPFERFYVGGSGFYQGALDRREVISLRGYKDYSLSPRGSGVYNKFNMEIRYPVSLGLSASIFITTFIEAASAVLDYNDFSPLDLKRSAGFGFRVFLPIFGVLGVDLGYGFDSSSGNVDVSGWQTHFVIGKDI